MIKQISTPRTVSTMSRSPRKSDKFPRSKLLELEGVLSQLIFKRKRYSFQILKQFYLFPSENASSENFISKYDRLIFDDDALHSMFKKMQTKIIENKIWGFINLKALKYIEQVKGLTSHVELVRQKIERKNTEISFSNIKKYSEHKKIKESTKLNSEKPINKMAQKFEYKREEFYQKSSIKTSSQVRKNPIFQNNHILSSENLRSRSRSQQQRLQFSKQDAKRILLNGDVIPVKIQVLRSVSPGKTLEYSNTNISSNAHYQYQTKRKEYAFQPCKKQSQIRTERRVSPQVIRISPQPRDLSPSYEYKISRQGLTQRKVEIIEKQFRETKTQSPNVVYRQTLSPSRVEYRYSPSQKISVGEAQTIDRNSFRSKCCHQVCCYHRCHHCCHNHCCQSHSQCCCSSNMYRNSPNSNQISPKRSQKGYLQHLNCYN